MADPKAAAMANPVMTNSILPSSKKLFHCEIHDEWESFLLRFTIFYPIDDKNEQLQLDSDRTGM